MEDGAKAPGKDLNAPAETRLKYPINDKFIPEPIIPGDPSKQVKAVEPKEGATAAKVDPEAAKEAKKAAKELKS